VALDLKGEANKQLRQENGFLSPLPCPWQLLLMLGCVPKQADPIIATALPTCVVAPDKKRKERQIHLVSIFHSSFADAGSSAKEAHFHSAQPRTPPIACPVVEVTEPAAN
jgi:hypothetical protein